MPESGPTPLSHELQFQHAEPLPSAIAPANPGTSCVACKRSFTGTYFHAQGQVICPLCAQRIQSGQQAPPSLSLARAALYGIGAAVGGCILYAGVAIMTGLEVGLIAIVVGYMVGKAIRHASHGLGGRPQQILAVLLTYFSITTSYVSVFVYDAVKHRPAVTQSAQKNVVTPGDSTGSAPAPRKKMTVSGALLYLLTLAAIAPFLSLGSGISGFLSLFIIFIGLRQAWRLTGRPEILVMGPYEPEPVAP